VAWVTPRTWVSGELGTAAAMNTVRDNFMNIGFVYTRIDVAAAGLFTNGWHNQGLPPVATIIRNGNWVYLTGQISGGTMSVSAFQVPIGYRPGRHLIFGAWSESSLGVEQLGDFRVNQDGTVIPNTGDNTSICFSFFYNVL